MYNVTIITDGSCIPQDPRKPGGWAAILRFGSHEKEIFGASLGTTSQQMELSAVIEAIECLKCPCSIRLETDSQYICETMKGNFKMKANGVLWNHLFALIEEGEHRLEVHKVRAHTGHRDNERCDALAKKALYTLLSE